RAGFRPRDAYHVSFVIMNAGTPFAKKGGGELALPRMDVPIGIVQWEVFLPERCRVGTFGGDVTPAALLPTSTYGRLEQFAKLMPAPALVQTMTANVGLPLVSLAPGSIGGYVADATGAVIPRAEVTVTHEATGKTETATTDQAGRWAVLNMPSGRVRVQTITP